MNSSKLNRKYWNEWNIKYSEVWQSAARQEMSKKEMAFIASKLVQKKPNLILDIGIGNGRILDVLSQKSTPKAKIFGIDISSKMVNICHTHFREDKKIVDLAICDLSEQKIPFLLNFDFVTMVRVLKYNENWQKMIKKVYQSLNTDGLYIFSMPNYFSISIMSGDKFSDNNSPIKYTGINELRKLLYKTGFTEFEFISFSKLPNFLYHLSDNPIYVRSLLFVEEIFEKLLGKSFLGRELFVCCQKK